MATPQLQLLDMSKLYNFSIPAKLINNASTLTHWQTSHAYTDITTFILQLNHGMFPTTSEEPPLEDPFSYSLPILGLRALILDLTALINDAPPDTGPRRFGNVAFRKWFSLAEATLPNLLERHIPGIRNIALSSSNTLLDELQAYLLGSFGSEQRLDYGTGHELSFLAFLACLCKVHLLPLDSPKTIVVGVLNPYLELTRTLIMKYTLEPAGSHGVWGLDDHSFLPYLFGSASLSPPLPSPTSAPPTEGSAAWAPPPSCIVEKKEVARWAHRNMYFGAIQFVHQVKRGPFWEHSPMLYDISGVAKGWAKINKGMIRMYAVEVLSKFPVVQHFVFGSILSWETDPTAEAPPSGAGGSVAHASAVEEREGFGSSHKAEGLKDAMTQPGMVHGTTGLPATAAPWAMPTGPAARSSAPGTSAPWANRGGAQAASGSSRGDGMLPATAAPWANKGREMPVMTAPWAKKEGEQSKR
jgi:serine/threonine-protein phosphatase 2A activator